MSMKSITINPARSLILICLLISSAASRFVLKAVSSIFLCFVNFPEFMSIATSASVWLITKYPPDFKFTIGLLISMIFFSIPNLKNNGFLSLNSFKNFVDCGIYCFTISLHLRYVFLLLINTSSYVESK